MAVDKVVRDGKVAVLVSPGYGAGWSTWADAVLRERMVFDPEVVAYVEAGKQGPFPDLETKYGDGYFYDGGAEDLVVMWVPVGTKFRIQEYDGAESLWLESEYTWYTA